MSDGPTDPEPGDGGNPEDGKILSPDELDIEQNEHVERIEEGRFVVSPDARPGTTENPQQPRHDDREERRPQESGSEPDTEQRPQATEAELTQQTVHQWLRESFEGTGSRYGFDVTATFEGSVSQRRMASNDVVTIFESLMLWYAQQVDSDTPVEEVLGILLMEANVPIRYPSASLKRLVKSRGLGPDDTIADLLAAVDGDDGLKL